jgi:GNAT superfamily N-acetyltransferase
MPTADMPDMPNLPDVTLANVGATSVVATQALAALRGGLGQGFISDERFQRYVTGQGGAPYRAALAATDSGTGAVIGALLFEVADASALRASFLNSGDQALGHPAIASLKPGRTGIITSIAVAPVARGRGVARALIQRGLRELTTHGAERAYALAWERADTHDCMLCGALTANGFQLALRLDHFWYHDSLAHGYVCPACGHPCVCAARVMVR